MKKKVIIFESIKGAGKTTLLTELNKRLKNSILYDEDITLKPVKHSQDKSSVLSHYERIIKEIENTDFEYYLLDRFHYTKWPIMHYDKNYFKEIEQLLLNKFQTTLVFLEIDEKAVLKRLQHTESQRKPAGWKLNYDGVSTDDEAKKDIEWQGFFLEHQFKDTSIQNKVKIDTTDLHLSLNEPEGFIQLITKYI